MIKHRIIASTALGSALALGLLGATAVSAHGMMGFGFMGMGTRSADDIAAQQQAMFTREAQITALSVDDIKNAWAAGKSLQQLMTERSITPAQVQQRANDARLAELKTALQALVSKGVITQSQADQRLAFVQNQKAPTRGARRGGRGFGGFGFGWR